MPSDPTSEFMVWHRTPEGPRPVALVRIGNLLGAAVLTISRVDAHWRENDGVTALARDARSTDVGDVIVSPEGRAYRIAATDLGPTFVPLDDFPPYREYTTARAARATDSAAGRPDLDGPFRDFFAARAGPPGPANDNDRDHEGGLER